jgi:GNAT superfamily N-acetyltransferase
MKLRRVAAADVDPREFVDGANRAFGAWGDEAMFRWAFRGDAEILFLDHVAASGMTYRMLRGGHPAAIITGSWTLPEARGRGAFTQLMEASKEIARERGAAFFGFGRQGNASERLLEAGGFTMTPTFYCRSIPSKLGEGSPIPFAALECVPDEPLPSKFSSSFVYSPGEWRAQFLERPHAHIDCIGRPGEWSAIVERVDDFDRVLAMSDPAALPQLAARAHASGRRLFWFALSRPSGWEFGVRSSGLADEQSRTRRLCPSPISQPRTGFEWTDGFMAVIPGLPFSDFTMQNGDRM